jgi:acyl carrier protein
VNLDDARTLIGDVLGGIAPEIDLATVDPAAGLVDDLDLDSIDFLNLVTGVAERTGRDIPERDYPRIASLDAFAAYLADTAG